MISNFNVYDVSRTHQLTTIEDFSNSLHTDLEWNTSDSTCQRRHQLHSPSIAKSMEIRVTRSQEKPEISVNRTSSDNAIRLFLKKFLFNMEVKNNVLLVTLSTLSCEFRLILTAKNASIITDWIINLKYAEFATRTSCKIYLFYSQRCSWQLLKYTTSCARFNESERDRTKRQTHRVNKSWRLNVLVTELNTQFLSEMNNVLSRIQ